MATEEGKWIKFELLHKGEKTSKYFVLAKEGGINLGQIKWFGRWRKYCFFPEANTVFETNCLDDINNFIKKLTDERKAKTQPK